MFQLIHDDCWKEENKAFVNTKGVEDNTEKYKSIISAVHLVCVTNDSCITAWAIMFSTICHGTSQTRQYVQRKISHWCHKTYGNYDSIPYTSDVRSHICTFVDRGFAVVNGHVWHLWFWKEKEFPKGLFDDRTPQHEWLMKLMFWVTTNFNSD